MSFILPSKLFKLLIHRAVMKHRPSPNKNNFAVDNSCATLKCCQSTEYQEHQQIEKPSLECQKMMIFTCERVSAFYKKAHPSYVRLDEPESRCTRIG